MPARAQRLTHLHGSILRSGGVDLNRETLEHPTFALPPSPVFEAEGGTTRRADTDPELGIATRSHRTGSIVAGRSGELKQVRVEAVGLPAIPGCGVLGEMELDRVAHLRAHLSAIVAFGQHDCHRCPPRTRGCCAARSMGTCPEQRYESGDRS